MLTCFEEKSKKHALPLHLVSGGSFQDWRNAQPTACANWLASVAFAGDPGATAVFPGDDGKIAGAVTVVDESPDLWSLAAAVAHLPHGTSWSVDTDLLNAEDSTLAWALESYRFERYKPARSADPARLCVGRSKAERRAFAVAEAIYLGRDLVNIPAFDLGPDELQASLETLAKKHGAKLEVFSGKRLEKEFPLIHIVGDASDRRPRLLDLNWGKAKAPRVTLVGKGVCFDTGGLDIKPANAMALMKKDMGGAALTIALADAIMSLNLKVRLRLLVPAVENSISGRAFRPGDVLKSRSGLSVEIGNTDAEGRLILADALDLADQQAPEILIDAATLTGAARVALGPELPVMFANLDDTANRLLAAGQSLAEPLWRLPLHRPYQSYIKSSIADLNNAGTKPFAGSITAALFLKQFVKKTANWVHLDIFGINDSARPGRPQGGEACGLRPLLHLIERIAAGESK